MAKPPYIDPIDEVRPVYEKLREIRESTTVSLKPSTYLREEITGFDGENIPLKIRYYQCQGIFHLIMMKRLVLGDGTGLGKCKTGNSLVLTDKGLRRLQDLAPIPTSEMALDTFYPMTRDTKVWTGSKWARIKSFYWSGSKPVRRITTDCGYVTDGSRVHPLWVRQAFKEGFVTMDALQVGDWVCLDRSQSDFPTLDPWITAPQLTGNIAHRLHFPNRLTPELARLLGWIVAEGTTTGIYHTIVTQWGAEGHADIRMLFKEVFGWEGNENNANAAINVEVASVDIRRFLDVCGVDYVTAAHKRVPPIILQGTRESVRHFLRGLFEGDGTVVVEGGVEYDSASLSLVRDVQQLLLRFGIVATISTKKIKGKPYYRLTFFGAAARDFQVEIGFISQRKEQELQRVLRTSNNTNKDVVPFLAPLVFRLRQALKHACRAQTNGSPNKPGWGIKSFGESFQSTLKHIIGGKRNATYRFLRQLRDNLNAFNVTGSDVDELARIINQHYYYDRIVKIEEDFAEVMDIEVDDPEHSFVADGFVNHNTLQAIASFCYLWQKETANRVIIIAPKSALRQWAAEIQRFTKGVRTVIATGSFDERVKAYDAFFDSPSEDGKTRTILLLNYHVFVRDWRQGRAVPLLPNGRPDPKNPVIPGYLERRTLPIAKDLVMIYDECTAFKNMRTKTWEVCDEVNNREGAKASRVYGLTATLLKNKLEEGFSIFKCIHPPVFTTKTAFLDTFCVTKMQSCGGNRKVPVIIGYKNLDLFRSRIDPFFLGRPKHKVSNELPTLTTREILFQLNPAECAKYAEAITGLFELGNGDLKDFEEHKAFVSLIYCQQVVNSLHMLQFKEGDEFTAGMHFDETHKIAAIGSKEQELVDLVTEELDGEKVIVYTRFESHVGRLVKLLADNGVKSVRITGAEKDKERKASQDAFQNLKSDTNVIFITAAGSEAINLQAASALVFYDSPWSWGDYVQIIGRMIRIGSPHKGVLVYHLVSERKGDTADSRATIDKHILKTLRSKKNLIDRVIGEAAIGALDFEKSSGSGSMRDLLRLVQGKSA